MSQGGGGRPEHSSRVNFPEISLRNEEMREFSGNIWENKTTIPGSGISIAFLDR
jgi:hypothetical protein